MKTVLEHLNRSVGVVGSAVMTHDGILVTSAIADRHDQDALTAIGSSLVQSTQRSLRNYDDSELLLMTIDGSRGRIVLVKAASAFLLIITDSTIALDATLLDIKSAVGKLQKLITLDA
ncbi:MAG TPA: roadblock/LC7 domain-containing protein [Planctomycetota bacterium]|nr:roadblock/LC7 domain-containing protein [Planctomycetota bacterium]HUV38891.1 roadblock/LC7 domain-containing protein [Planctomycetota bacterium]